LWDNYDGVDDRYKYRIRIYNYSDKVIKLEKKGTLHGLKTKESCVITRQQYEQIIQDEEVEYDRGSQSLLERFLTEKSYQLFEPKVIVEYTRTPYVYSAGNVRVTFDRKILSAPPDDFFRKDIPVRPVLADGMGLLEVKYDEYLPGAIREAIGVGNSIHRISFSKYAMCREHSVI
nr:polyphosphate polymerase domain-containing protein [Acetatifactor sp.]